MKRKVLIGTLAAAALAVAMCHWLADYAEFALGGVVFGAIEGLLLALVCWCTGRAMQSEKGALFGMLAVMAITMKALGYAIAMALLGKNEGAALTCFLVGAGVVYSGAVGWAAVRR